MYKGIKTTAIKENIMFTVSYTRKDLEITIQELIEDVASLKRHYIKSGYQGTAESIVNGIKRMEYLANLLHDNEAQESFEI